jgi:disulfide bond formation protein DsbB
VLLALVSQYGFGLHPCEMCYWQRWPHQAAIVLALLALLLRRNDGAMRALTLLAAVAIAISGAIGIFHAGVEYGWWQGLTTCSSTGSGPVTLDSIMAAPIVRCDVPQWTLGPISLAGFNAIFSLAAAAFVLTLLRRRPTSVA